MQLILIEQEAKLCATTKQGVLPQGLETRLESAMQGLACFLPVCADIVKRRKALNLNSLYRKQQRATCEGLP